MNKITKAELQTGDILLDSGSSFIARAIQFFQGNPYNHAKMYVSLWGADYFAESEAKGLVLNTYADSMKKVKKSMVARCRLPYEPRYLAHMLLPMIGKHRYDFFSLLFFQLIYVTTGRLFKLLNIKKDGVWLGRRDKHASKKLYCSELIAYLYNRMFPTIFTKWWKYNPAMLQGLTYMKYYELDTSSDHPQQ